MLPDSNKTASDKTGAIQFWCSGVLVFRAIGQYNHEILCEQLGYSGQQITDFKDDGVIASSNS